MLTLVFVSHLSFGQVVKLEKHQIEKMNLTCKRFENYEKRFENRNVKSEVEPFRINMIKRKEIIMNNSEK
jgi:hypothetical protein